LVGEIGRNEGVRVGGVGVVLFEEGIGKRRFF
jgi:hypothetical protein